MALRVAWVDDDRRARGSDPVPSFAFRRETPVLGSCERGELVPEKTLVIRKEH